MPKNQKAPQGQGLEFRLAKGWKSMQEPWRAFVLEVAMGAQGEVYHRNARGKPNISLEVALINAGKPTPEIAYVRINGPGKQHHFDCTGCGAEIQIATVCHNIDYRGLSREVQQEAVPYCPSCEGKPDIYGEPIPAEPKKELRVVGQPYATVEETKMWQSVMSRARPSGI